MSFFFSGFFFFMMSSQFSVTIFVSFTPFLFVPPPSPSQFDFGSRLCFVSTLCFFPDGTDDVKFSPLLSSDHVFCRYFVSPKFLTFLFLPIQPYSPTPRRLHLQKNISTHNSPPSLLFIFRLLIPSSERHQNCPRKAFLATVSFLSYSLLAPIALSRC